MRRSAVPRGSITHASSPGGRIRGVGRAARTCLFLVFTLLALTMAVPGKAYALPGLDDLSCKITGDDNYQLDQPGVHAESIFPAVSQWEENEDKRAQSLSDSRGMVSGAAPMDADHPEKYTMYELNALRGLDWSMTFKGKGDASEENGARGSGADKCSVMDWVNNNVADIIFNITKILTRVSISIKEQASNPSPLSGLYEGRNNVVETLKSHVFIPAVPIMILLTGLWVFTKWRAGQMREIWAGVGWAALSTVAVVALLTGGNFGKVINEADSGIAKFNAALSEAALSGVTGEMQPPCDLPKKAPNRGLRSSSCAMYDTLAFRPWAMGQFGDVGANCIFREGGGRVEKGACIPASEGTECHYGKGARCEDLRARQVASQSVNNIEFFNPGKYEKEDPDWFNKIDEAWEDIRQDIAVGEDEPDKTNYPVAFNEWAGRGAGTRVGIAFYSLLAALIVGIMVIVLSALTLLWHAVTLILIILLPLVAAIGIHPSQQKILKGWLETFIHSFVLRAGFGVILTVLLVLYQMILPADIALGTQLLMLILVAVAVVMMLKKLIAGNFSPKIAGAEDALGVGDMPGVAGGKALAYAPGAVGTTARTAVGTTKFGGRVAGKAAAGTGVRIARGTDSWLNKGRLQKGGWLPTNKSWRQRNKSEYQAKAEQQRMYNDAQPPTPEEGQQQPQPHRGRRVSAPTGGATGTGSGASQQSATSSTPQPQTRTPAPQPLPQQPAKPPQQPPSRAPRQPAPGSQSPQPAQPPRLPQQPQAPQQPQQPPAPRNDGRIQR
ncbi:hypothetical protein I3F58_11750 [Streptomyces sp. MUM 203J]|uniref:hypothetical protein n=1 Tax=Streptomyces sp. MUM 203J TaxID=2791990 RepID=UPI001F032F25|nr:hypothetical protein [Streptomyces sp. MUM 203J]MCH0540232.1 hypothetical protein [Streptomyces sp. MUM 203J]